MKRREAVSRRRDWTPLLFAGFAVLLVVLAVTLWRWLYLSEGHEHNQRARQVSQAGWNFKLIFDREVEGLARAFLAPAASRELSAEELALRRARWRSSARWPDLLAGVYRWQGNGSGGETGLEELRPDGSDGEGFRAVPWPADLAELRDAMQAGESEGETNGVSPEPALPAAWELSAPGAFFVEASAPALVLPMPAARPADSPDALILLLDRRFLADTVLPEIVELVFPPPTFDAVDVAVVEAEGGRVLFSTLAVDQASDFGPADSVYGLVPVAAAAAEPREGPEAPARRAGTFGSRPGVSAVPPSSRRTPTAADEAWFAELWAEAYGDGRWRLLVRRGEAPIPQVVAAVRWRRVAFSFGILAFLAGGVAVLTVGARRTQRSAREQLQQLARVSHELRTPLAVLSTAGENLADDLVRDKSQVRRYGEVIQKETRRLREHVENVLLLARERSGVRSKLVGSEPRELDLVALLEDCLATMEPALRKEGFRLERRLPPEPVPVVGRPEALRSAVLNLLSNAVKYGRSGRWVRLALERDEADVGEGEIRVVVADRGPGLDREEVRRLFEPYFRGARATLRQTEGSGLGLAVVKEVAEAHRGRVSVAAADGGGAVFTLHLPGRLPGGRPSGRRFP